MKFDVNQDKCLRCGMCTGIAIDVFEFDDDGNIKVNNENINEENKSDVESAIDLIDIKQELKRPIGFSV